MCFCGPGSTALPAEPLEAHDNFCLLWDWAMACGKITPQEMLARLGDAQKSLGLTDEEVALEAAGLRPPMPLRNTFPRWQPGTAPRHMHHRNSSTSRCSYCGLLLYPSPWQSGGGGCYRAPAGFMVHVRPGCEC